MNVPFKERESSFLLQFPFKAHIFTFKFGASPLNLEKASPIAHLHLMVT